jgi:hypothetical protein
METVSRHVGRLACNCAAGDRGQSSDDEQVRQLGNLKNLKN